MPSSEPGRNQPPPNEHETPTFEPLVHDENIAPASRPPRSAFVSSMNEVGQDVDPSDASGNSSHRLGNPRRLRVWLTLPLLVLAVIVSGTILVVQRTRGHAGSSNGSTAHDLTTVKVDGASRDDGGHTDSPSHHDNGDILNDGADSPSVEVNIRHGVTEENGSITLGARIALPHDGENDETSASRPATVQTYSCPSDESQPTVAVSPGSIRIRHSAPLCTLIRVSSSTTSFQPIARSYNNKPWKVIGSTEAMESSPNLIQFNRCGRRTCMIQLPAPEDGHTYELKTFNAPAYSDRDIISRFLEQTTFGVTSAALDQMKTEYDASSFSDLDDVFAKWIEDQQDTTKTPIQSHRALFRQFLNAQFEIPTIVGRTTQPCEVGTRYRHEVFIDKDIGAFLELKTVTGSNGQRLRAISKVRNGVARLYTIVDFTMYDYDYAHESDSEAYVPTTRWDQDGLYTICWIAGSIYVENADRTECHEMIFKDPAVPAFQWEEAFWVNPFVTSAAKDAILASSDSVVLNVPTSSQILKPIDQQYYLDDYEDYPLRHYILANSMADSQCNTATFEPNVPVFVQHGDDMLIHDPRFKLLDNTLENVLPDGGGQVFADHADLLDPYETVHCANTPRTFLNEDNCYVSTSPSACSPLMGWVDRSPDVETGYFTLTEDLIRKLYKETGGTEDDSSATTRYWYAVQGLDQSRQQLTDPKPCDQYSRSRWIPVTCNSAELGAVNAGVATVFSALISDYKVSLNEQNDMNPYMMDVWLWEGEQCPDGQRDTAIDFMVQDDDGDCWKNVHQDHLNVYDFTEWVNGGHNGGPAPIAAFAKQGSARLNFPGWHEMSRWNYNKGDFDGPWRLGDEVNFYQLPREMRNEEMAKIFGVTLLEPGDPELTQGYGSLSGVGTVVCGSPYEVANDPTNGGSVTNGGWINRGSFDANTRRFATSYELFEHQNKYVWLKATVENEVDQLRQRMAWALSQILVITPDGADADLSTEPFLVYYDTFVRHAFGNYRDVLKEVSYNPLMANMLTYYSSQSTAFVYQRDGVVEYADENFAREVMQLFTTGLFQLNMDGTKILDEAGSPKRVYTNEDIEEYARAWTGFEQQEVRGNAENLWRNYIDPMYIREDWRDRFPKMGLNRKYVGDGYPLCADLPDDHFLQPGAVYRFLGPNPHPELHSDIDAWKTDPSAQRFKLDASNSGLYTKLCNPRGDGSCDYKTKIVLDQPIQCSGKECCIDTVRTVEVSAGMYYEYIRKPCVHQSFYENAKTIIRHWEWGEYMCADPRTESAIVACCKTNPTNNFYDDVYWGERTKFSTALDACDEQLCSEWPRPDCEAQDDTSAAYTKCWDPNHFWTSESCTLKAKISGDGKVGIVHAPFYGDDQVELIVAPSTKTLFRVDWSDDVKLVVDNCAWISGCIVSEDNMCVCEVTVSNEAVFTGNDSPSDQAILQALHIGGFEASPAGQPLSADTVFEVVDEYGMTQLRKNVVSTVSLVGAGLSFRNPPHFISLSDEEPRDAHHETDAVLDHYMYHPNTAPFLAVRFAQRFGNSNPSPYYIKSIATAFKSGRFTYNGAGGTKTFGSGSYGDLGAAVAAVLLSPESRDVILDADPAYGALKEPLLKVTGILRSLDYEQRVDKGLLKLNEFFGSRLGQMAHEIRSVFSFFLPEFQPSGRIMRGNLVAPEAQLVTPPRQVTGMNGMYSLIRYGLTQCYGGYGPYVRWCPENVNWGDVSDSSFGFLTYESGSTSNLDATIDELATLLTSGRLTMSKRDYVKQIMAAESNPTKAMEKGLQLIVTAPEFHATNLVRTTGTDRPPQPPVSPSPRGYKAVVHVLLDGGMDSYNMLAPHTCTQRNSNGLTVLDQYNSERTTIALTEGERTRIIQASGQPCSEFAIHPELPVVESLYKSGDLAFFANMGVLDTPVTTENYDRLSNTDLFAHNTMQLETQRVDPWDKTPTTGILGRVSDVLATKGYKPQPITIQDASVATVGVPGQAVEVLVVSAEGMQDFNPRPNGEVFDAKDHVARMNQQTGVHSSVFGELWSGGLHKAISDVETLKNIVSNVPLTQDFNTIQDSDYRTKFETVSNFILTHEGRGADRDLFFMELGSWDHHSQLKTQQANEFQSLNAALDTFQKEMKAQGMWDQVTVVLTSEFARTLTANSGEGSDHAWGGNYFTMGGDVKGGQILGKYPEDMTLGGPYNIGRGRLIPHLSYESMMNGVAEWMGVEGKEELDYCMPNRERAGAPLYDMGQTFKTSRRKLRGDGSPSK